MPDEDPAVAVHRRVWQELGMRITDLRLVLPHFSYRATDSQGVVEHELCPVWVAAADDDPQADPAEVDEWRWASPKDVGLALRMTPWAFSPWLAEQAQQLEMFASRP